MNAEAAIEHADALRERAREYKRAEQRARRRARMTMDELRRFCAEHGITLKTTETQGGQSHHGSERAA